MLVPPSQPFLGKTLVLGGLAASLVSITIASAALATQVHATPPADPCAPAFDPSALSAHERGLVARRLLACADLEHGRIGAEVYAKQIAAIDAAWTATPPTPPPAPAIQWASTVRGFSTQYTASSWAATKLLGAPDVFPGGGDNANAWASLGADDRDEWVEVGYAQPIRVSAVDVFETFNPGAVSAIELVTASGQRISAYQGAVGATGASSNRLHVDTGCTAEPIVAVTVRLDSKRVAGWNELDAIGLSPCAEQ